MSKVDFTGWIPHDAIPPLLNRMKIHILPSHTESLGGSNLEAMACGAICIANSVGGLPDIIDDGRTGFLLKDNSPRSMADKMIEVLERPDLEAIQKNARILVEERFTYEKVVEGWRGILSGL